MDHRQRRSVVTGECGNVDDFGRHVGWCNACGEEALLDSDCCDDGEVVPYSDEECEDA